MDYSWSYDAASRITEMTLPDGDASFTLDATDQLLTADYDEEWQDNEGYTYDDNGNRTNLGYETGDANQLVTDGHYRYEYDAEGNRTLRFVDEDESEHLNSGDTDITTFAWDHRNRLVGVSHYATEAAYGSSSPDQVVEYTYDYLDRRIARTLDSDGDGTVDEYTYQLHRGDELAMEFSDQDGLEGETYDPELAHRYLYGAAVDQILAVENASGDVLWGLADHEGTIRDVVQHDGQDTVLANHVQYDSFGNPTESTAPIADFLFAFTGRPLDPDTDLYDYRARWYDPQVGRFLSEDPIASDPNLYRYCGNSPLMNVDPSGLCFSSLSSAFNSVSSAFQGVVSTATSIASSMATAASQWTTQTFGTAASIAIFMDYGSAPTVPVQPLVMPRAVPSPAASRSIQLPVSGTGLGQAVRELNVAGALYDNTPTLEDAADMIGTGLASLASGAWHAATDYYAGLAEWTSTLFTRPLGAQADWNMQRQVSTINSMALDPHNVDLNVNQFRRLGTIGTGAVYDILESPIKTVEIGAAAGDLMSMPIVGVSAARSLLGSATARVGTSTAARLAPSAVPSHLTAGRAYHAERVAAFGAAENTAVWRPTMQQTETAAFRVVVGQPSFTPGGLPVGTTIDVTQGGLLEFKSGSSVLNSSYQLRLQTYQSLIENTPYTIETTRPINPTFQGYLQRWGVNVRRPQ